MKYQNYPEGYAQALYWDTFDGFFGHYSKPW